VATTLLPNEVTVSVEANDLKPPTRNYTVTKTIKLGGREKSVIVCDCDGRWSTTGLASVISNLLHQRFGQTFSEMDFILRQLSTIIDKLTHDALRRLHIFTPHSSASLAATLMNLPLYHFERMQGEEIFMLVIDSGPSSFIGRIDGRPSLLEWCSIKDIAESLCQSYDARFEFFCRLS
jgi:DNA-repair protein XRCC2